MIFDLERGAPGPQWVSGEHISAYPIRIGLALDRARREGRIYCRTGGAGRWVPDAAELGRPQARRWTCEKKYKYAKKEKSPLARGGRKETCLRAMRRPVDLVYFPGRSGRWT